MNTPFSHRTPQRWIKLTFQISDNLADLSAAFIADITGKGVEQSMPLEAHSPLLTTVTGYLDNDDIENNVEEQIRAFLQHLCGVAPNIHLEEIVEEDWGINWKKHFKPVRVSQKIIVKPTWEPYLVSHDEIIIEIDPGLAFGTGLHASTRLALQLVEACFSDNSKPQKVLDVGTGTGILGIAAAKLGAHLVLGIDNDADAIACARDNIRQNGVDSIMTVSEKTMEMLKDQYDLVVANITSDILQNLAPQLIESMAPKGKLVLAGILAGEQAKTIERTFVNRNLTLLTSPLEGEWQAFLFTS